MFSPFLSLLFFPQKNWLVVSTPLQNMKVSWDDYSQYMEKYRTCSKPPTRSYGFPMVFLWFSKPPTRKKSTIPDSPRRIPPPQVPFRCQGHRRPGAPGGAEVALDRWEFSQLPCFLTGENKWLYMKLVMYIYIYCIWWIVLYTWGNICITIIIIIHDY